MNIDQFEIKRVTQTTQFKQQGLALAIVFNNIGSIMIAGCEKDLKIWNLIGRSKQLRRLAGGQNENVCCIILSKIILWFASGSLDGVIFSWNEKWISNRPQQKHTKALTQLLLNKNEDEIISCSHDQTIKVWKVNCQSNNIQYVYDLEKLHTWYINCMSLNESESYLVSCGCDKTIILWYKNQNIWKFLNKFQNQEMVFRISFITDLLFIFKPYFERATEMIEIRNGELVNRPEFKFQINKDHLCHQLLFRNIYNIEKQIIFQITDRQIYFLKKFDDCLKVIYGPLSCPKNDICGTVKLNGEILVFWNDESRDFRIYKIQ